MEGRKGGWREGGRQPVPTTSSSESSRPWMLLPSRTACWWPTPLVWLNRCTSEVICPNINRRSEVSAEVDTPDGGQQEAPPGRPRVK